MSKKPKLLSSLKLSKFVHGGQCLAETTEGKKVFVWGGLPGEVVDAKVTNSKRNYFEAIAVEVIKPSPERIAPLEPNSYISTSPWQILDFAAENTAKQAILEDAYTQESIDGINWEPFISDGKEFGYRNKQEYGFWGDDEGLHLAHFLRGSHGKVKIDGSALASDSINQAARDVRDELSRLNIWGGKLKTLMLRCSENGQVAGSLFVKEELDFSEFNLPSSLKGIVIYYSEPKSPASVATKELKTFGDISLSDDVLGQTISYDVMSFFQVNLPVFEIALKKIKSEVKNIESVDMYSGVGTIGISAGASVLVESDKANIVWADQNTSKAKVVHATSEQALDYITNDKILIVDPPRAGLHKDVVEKINEVLPPKVVYLSCNPSTQARDVKLLADNYKVSFAQGFNFFPRTPHIESLLILDRI